jgi:DNA-binding IclR family transcriptional regulator
MAMDELEDQTTVRSVARAVDLLIVLGTGPKPLREISAEVGLTKPTTYRLLSTLRSKGMVLQDSMSGEYGLGPACFHLMSAVVNGHAGFVLDDKPTLQALRDETGETITVHTRAGLSRICIQEFPSPHPIRYIAGLGATASIHIGSAGKVLLAFMPADERERVLADVRLTAMTANTITDRTTLNTELEKVARQGYAISHGERVDGAVGVSAPILDATGRALAALSVLGPSQRLGSRLKQAQKQVMAAGASLSQTMQKALDGNN